VLTFGAAVDGCARALPRAGTANADVLIFVRVADAVRTSI
jgi:predicted amidophosphoribosyltransferase